MKIIVPMAGFGDRFKNAGYENPKPFIKISGKRIIEYILEMFDVKNDDIIFICNKEHSEYFYILKELVPNSKILPIEPHKYGPVYTVINSGVLDLLPQDEEAIVTYCDNPYIWDYSHFKSWTKINNIDGCVISHIGFHPHRLSSTFMAHMKTDGNKILEIKEKEPYSNEFMNEHASTGTYYFKKIEYIKKYFNELIERNISYNNEYYVTLVYNLLIRDGLNVNVYPTDYVMVFGTPEEVENFEAWQIILSKKQIKTENDLVKCYTYWRNYNERNSQ